PPIEGGGGATCVGLALLSCPRVQRGVCGFGATDDPDVDPSGGPTLELTHGDGSSDGSIQVTPMPGVPTANSILAGVSSPDISGRGSVGISEDVWDSELGSVASKEVSLSSQQSNVSTFNTLFRGSSTSRESEDPRWHFDEILIVPGWLVEERCGVADVPASSIWTSATMREV
ncbi:hypothetical protein Hamer_G012120, partial [Homarus americanus]